MTFATSLVQQRVLLPRARFSAASSRSARLQVVSRAHGRFFIGGNWKCNGTVESVKQLVNELNAGRVPDDVDVVVAPTFIHLDMVKNSLRPPFQISAQNCWVGKGGAYTGEVSAEMLRDAGIPWVILGHSERRSLCGEDNETVGVKVDYALSQGLKVIACIGETLQQRETGHMFDVLDAQLRAIANHVRAGDWANVVVAYEPVWAIGTGVVATPDQAQEAHAFVRKWVAENVSRDVAATLRILYGGSVNDANCVDLAGLEDVDGFLVGGASLKGSSFINICNADAKQLA